MLRARTLMSWRLGLSALISLLCLAAAYAMADPTDNEAQSASVEDGTAQDALTVTRTGQLLKALQNVHSATTITLAPGNYGRVYIVDVGNDLPAGERITITSADPCLRARFSHLTIESSRNITLKDLEFADPDFFNKPIEQVQKPDGTPRHLNLLRTAKSSTLEIIDNTFTGPTIDLPGSNPLNGFGHGGGWRAENIDNVIFKGNRMSNTWKGMTMTGLRSVQIINNLITDYRSDAIFIRGAQDLTIKSNELTYPRPFMLHKGKGDHPDFMQIFDISGGVIEDNFMLVGPHEGLSQGIFPGKPAKDLVVRNNIIISRMRNGILLDDLTDSQVTNNLVVAAEGSPGTIQGMDGIPLNDVAPQIRISKTSGHVVVRNNATSAASDVSSAAYRSRSGLLGADIPLGSRPFFRASKQSKRNTQESAGYRRLGDIWFDEAVLRSVGIDATKFTYLTRRGINKNTRCRTAGAGF